MKIHPGLIAMLPLLVAVSLSAQDRSYGRSVVSSPYGIVATTWVQASQAGAMMLDKGGSAIDAAIAANAVLNASEPMMNGMGGDLFAIYWDAKSGKLYGLNASGWAPQALTIEHLRSKGMTAMPQKGIDSVTVPGMVDGWTKLHARWGKLPWAELFEPAIFYADHGVTVPEMIHDYWAASAAGLQQNAESQRVFLPEDKVPEAGQIFMNRDLANALRIIAEHGEDAFYKGPIADAILKTSQANGGTMTADDLANYSAEWVDPISTTYRDWTVYELPPNGDGMAALEMLNIMEQFTPDPAGPRSPGELHTRIEAMKLAYADVKAYNGDPRFSKIPVDQLISKAWAAERAKLIDRDRANCSVAPGALAGSDTTYLSVVDHDGNIVSFIQSNYAEFGSGIGGWYGVRPAGSRRAVFSRSEIAECPGRAQAALPHHHSRLYAARRRAHWLRHHGRIQSAAGACAVRIEHRRLSHEHPGRTRGAALYGERQTWLPHRD